MTFYTAIEDREEAAYLHALGFSVEIERENFAYTFFVPRSDALDAARSAFQQDEKIQAYIRSLKTIKKRMRRA